MKTLHLSLVAILLMAAYTPAAKADDFQTNLGILWQSIPPDPQQIISKLEQNIDKLPDSLRLQLKLLQDRSYYGPMYGTANMSKDYSITFDGMAQVDQSKVTECNMLDLPCNSNNTEVHGNVIIEDIATTGTVSKYKITGGGITIAAKGPGGKYNGFDILFGKARLVKDENAENLVAIAHGIDSKGKITTVTLFFHIDTMPDGNSPTSATLDKSSMMGNLVSLRGSAQVHMIESLSEVQSTCVGQIAPSGDGRTGVVPVLLMPLNHTAVVCITYKFPMSWESYPNKEVYPEGIIEFGRIGFQYQTSDQSSSAFRIMSSPDFFNATGVPAGYDLAITYTIYASPNSKGFYDSTIPYGYCSRYPMAVGYDASEVNASDFSRLNVLLNPPCFLSLDQVDSVKIVSGMSYKEIGFQ